MDHRQVGRKSHWRSLVRKSEFQEVYEHGVKWVGRFVVVYVLVPKTVSAPDTAPADKTSAGRGGSNGEPDLAHAVVASKKVGNAVARNRAKRLLREARRLDLLGDPASQRKLAEVYRRHTGPAGAETDGGPAANEPMNEHPGLWVVLVARQRILDAGSRQVREELAALLGSDPQPH